jgi:hypothetical protein
MKGKNFSKTVQMSIVTLAVLACYATGASAGSLPNGTACHIDGDCASGHCKGAYGGEESGSCSATAED